MRTELARVQTEAQKQSFIRNGFDHYEFITNSGCCGDCQELNGKHFPVEKMMPGENAPPLHPHCRCSTAAWEDETDYEAWIDYLDKGGSTESWNNIKERANSIQKGIEISGNSAIIRLNNHDVRDWYVSATERIKDGIDHTLPIEEQALQAFNERNRIRIMAREMMADQDARKGLDRKYPNLSFDALVERKMRKKKITREEAIRDVYKTATTTNENVNKEFGIGGD